MKRKSLNVLLAAATITCILTGCGNATVESSSGAVTSVGAENSKADESVVSKDSEEDSAEAEATAAPTATAKPEESEAAKDNVPESIANSKEGAEGETEGEVQAETKEEETAQAETSNQVAANGSKDSKATTKSAQGTTNQATDKAAKTSAEATTQATQAPVIESFASPEFISILNEHRVQSGLPEISYASNLEAGAEQRAMDIVDNFSHDGYEATGADLENIATSVSSNPADWYAAWAASPSHLSNLMEKGLVEGSAYAYGIDGYYYVVFLGTVEYKVNATAQEVIEAAPEERMDIIEEKVESGEMVQIGSQEEGGCDWYVDADSYCSDEQWEQSKEETGLSDEEIWQNAYNSFLSLGFSEEEAADFANNF